jgi:hypothetical protein
MDMQEKFDQRIERFLNIFEGIRVVLRDKKPVIEIKTHTKVVYDSATLILCSIFISCSIILSAFILAIYNAS